MIIAFEKGCEQWEVEPLDWFTDGDWKTFVYVKPWSLGFDPGEIDSVVFPWGSRPVDEILEGGCAEDVIVLEIHHPATCLDEVLT